MRKSSDAGLLLGAAALAGALLLFATVFARAQLSSPVTAVPVPAPASIPDALGSGPAVSVGERPADAEDPADGSVTAEVLRLAVDRAPFAPDRQTPLGRYRMPGERTVVAEAPPAPPELPPAPDFRLLGTVTGADGGIAVVQIEGERPHVMAMGEELFGYRIASIGSGSVTMEGPGRNVNLAVAGPMPTGPAASNEEGGRDRQDPRDRNAIEQQNRALGEMVRQMQERSGGEVEVRMRDGQVVVQGANGQIRTFRLPTGDAQVRGAVTVVPTFFPHQQRPPPR